MAKLFRQKSSISGLVSDLLNINTSITNEATRAGAEEVRIEGLLSTEVARATSAEDALTTSLASEVARATSAEGTLTTNLASEVARATSAEDALTDALGVEATVRSAAVIALTDAIALEQTQRVAADNIHDTRLATIEGGMIAGTLWKGSVPSLVELDALVEADVVNGWAYFVTTLNDAYVVIDGIDGDYVPAGWTTQSFIKFADYTELSGLVSTERTARIDADSTELARALNAEQTISIALSAEVTRATQEEADLATAILAEEARAMAEEARLDSVKLAKSANLSDLTDIAVARTNISVYSKAEVDATVSGQSTKTKNDTGVITAGVVTFSKVPLNGVDGVAFGIVRIFGVDGTNPMAYDEVQVTLDASDISGKSFVISSDIAGEYDGKTAMAFVSYNPNVA